MSNTQVAELVFVPAPSFLSHFVPAIELAKLITKRNQHISILILILDNPTNSHNTKAFVESKSVDASSHGRLTFLTLPPLSLLPDPSASPNLIIELNKPLIKQAIDNRIQASFATDHIKELAIGLERSGYPFLWTLPKKVTSVEGVEKHVDDDPYGDLLPESFLGRTRERGKVIGWAPQVAILAHPAVGGFLSHCGWSSTLETLWFRVPVATWPLFADHQLVASMLVKELGLAVEIRMDYQHAFKTKKGSILV
uniref:Uncharacterized protein n=1 Tax=Chenopodium quinoa TaxID=63459 RepID=A0A803MCP6_CHEQI